MNQRSGGWKFWRRIPLRAQLMAGFILPVMLIGMSSYVVHRSLGLLEIKSTEVQQSVMSIALRNMLLNAVLNAESGERGYVITGKSDFLGPYHQALERFTDTANRLKALRPDATAEIAQLEELFNQWLNEVAKPVIAARQQSPGRLDSYGGNALYHLKKMKGLLDDSASVISPEQQAQLTEFSRLITEAATLSIPTANAAGWAQLLAWEQQLQQLINGREFNIEQALPVIGQIEDKLNELTHLALENEYQAIQIIASGAGKKLIDEIRPVFSNK